MLPTQISCRLFSPRGFFLQVFSGLRLAVVSVLTVAHLCLLFYAVLYCIVLGCSITYQALELLVLGLNGQNK